MLYTSNGEQTSSKHVYPSLPRERVLTQLRTQERFTAVEEHVGTFLPLEHLVKGLGQAGLHMSIIELKPSFPWGNASKEREIRHGKPSILLSPPPPPPFSLSFSISLSLSIPHSLSFSHSLSLPLFISLPPSHSLYVFLSVFVSLCLFLALSLSLLPSLSPSLFLLFIFLSLSPSLSPFLSPSLSSVFEPPCLLLVFFPSLSFSETGGHHYTALTRGLAQIIVSINLHGRGLCTLFPQTGRHCSCLPIPQ